MRLRPEAYGFVEGVRWALGNFPGIVGGTHKPPMLFEVLTEARKRWPDFESDPEPVKRPNLHAIGERE